MSMEIKPRSSPWTPSDPATIVIPGVDPTASINEQIDRIDQLITIKLQNIDANIAKAQHLIATKLLPAFKRFAEGTEPVREAAKFWKSFYEAAAQVRIPLASDASLNQTEEETNNSQEGEQQEVEEEGDTTAETYEGANTTPLANDSFMHGVPISSTPLIRDNKAHEDEGDSWSASIESPFERLHREVQSLTIEEKGKGPSQLEPLPVPLSKPHTDTLPPPTRPQPAAPPPLPPVSQPRNKGKAPIRENILHQRATAASSSRGVPVHHQPPRSRTPKNPFTNTRQWNGLVDLRQPTPSRHYTREKDLSFDDSSDDLIPPGMSPPVTMQFALPPRLRKSPVKLYLSPAKKAAENIKRDYIANAASKGLGSTSRLQRQSKLEPSISSVAPSLPSISKYGYPSPSRIPSTVSRGSKTSLSTHSSTSQQRADKILTPAHQVYRSRIGAQPQTTATAAELINEEDDTIKLSPQDRKPVIMPKSRLLIDDEGSLSPDSDSDSSEHNEQNPSNGFLYATQNNAQADDSFSDDGNDSITEMVRPDDQLHPVIDMFAQFGQQNIDGDDSFDQDSFSSPPRGGNEEEETIFGGRQAGQGDRRFNLNLRNDPLIDDSHTGAISLNPFAQVEQSPTPYPGQTAPLN